MCFPDGKLLPKRFFDTNEKNPGCVRFIFLFILLPMILISIYFGILYVINAIASSGWPITKGMIISSSVYKHAGDNIGYSDAKITYKANVVYKYSLNGVEYTGSAISFGDCSSSDSEYPKGILRNYPPGKTVMVHYCPGKPYQAVLETGLKLPAWFLPTFCIVFLVVSCLYVNKVTRFFKFPFVEPKSNT